MSREQLALWGGPARPPLFPEKKLRRHQERRESQLSRIEHAMLDMRPHTLAELAALTNDPEASISARIRDLANRLHYRYERRELKNGIHTYRLLGKDEREDGEE